MTYLRLVASMLLIVLASFTQQTSSASAVDPVAYSLFQQTNHERVARNLPPLHWDQVLEKAAQAHLKWLVRNRELSHQFPGEPDLAARTAKAGAYLSVVAENLALGPDAAEIHSGWMHSPHHRDNILDSRLDGVGFAVAHIAEGYMVVADYGLRVEQLSPDQVEAKIAVLLKQKNIFVSGNHARARETCAMEDGVPGGKHPHFVMRWQSSDLARLPDALIQRLPNYPKAIVSVGACPAQGEANFSGYRVAVLID